MFFIIQAICILSALSYGFVITRMWNWFIMPIFHLPILPFWYAVGLMMFVCLIRPVFPTVPKEMLEDKEYRNKILFSYTFVNLIKPWVTLITGWIVTFFLP